MVRIINDKGSDSLNFKDFFQYDSQEIPADKVFLLTERILDDLYSSSSEIERCNIFFHLQNEYFYLKNRDAIRETAYICYLISYYLFTPLTPPHSDTLACEFAKKAVELDSSNKYVDWLNIVANGN